MMMQAYINSFTQNMATAENQALIEKNPAENQALIAKNPAENQALIAKNPAENQALIAKNPAIDAKDAKSMLFKQLNNDTKVAIKQLETII